MKNINFQKDFDIRKWIESEQANKDLCGTYEFCAYCNKDLDLPCERAFNLYKEDLEVEMEEEKSVVSGKHYPTFLEKLAKASDETKAKYDELIGLLQELGFEPMMLKYSVAVRYQGLVYCGKITLSWGVLRLHLALNPSSYMRYKHFDFADVKAYQNYPFTFKYGKGKNLKSTRPVLEILKKKVEKKL